MAYQIQINRGTAGVRLHTEQTLVNTDIDVYPATVTRATTKATARADSGQHTIEITASNNQAAGWLTESEEASVTTTVNLDTDNKCVTVTDADNNILASVAVPLTTPPSNIKPLYTLQTVEPRQGDMGLNQVVINAIPEEYVDTSDATVVYDSSSLKSSSLLEGETAYAKGKKITGTIPTRNAARVTINENKVNVMAGYYNADVNKEIDTTKGAIAVNYTYPVVDDAQNQIYWPITYEVGTGGYIAKGTYTDFQNEPEHQANFHLQYIDGGPYTPTKTKNTIYSNGCYCIGDIIINPIPDNYIDPSDATASVSDILTGKTAYINGGLKTGTLATDGELKISNIRDSDDGWIDFTITPTKKSVYYTTQDYDVRAEDNNFKASNIKSGVSIFGVTGTFVGADFPASSIIMPHQELKVGASVELWPLAFDGETATISISSYSGDSTFVDIDDVTEYLEVTGVSPGFATVTMTYSTAWYGAAEGYVSDITRTLSYPITVYAAEVEGDPPSVSNWTYGSETGASTSGSYEKVTAWTYS